MYVRMVDMSQVLAFPQPHWNDRIIGGTINGLLTTRGNNVDDLCTATGINRTTLYRKLRSGQWKAWEVKTIADALQVPVGDLYAGTITEGPGLPRHDSNVQPSDLQFRPTILADWRERKHA